MSSPLDAYADLIGKTLFVENADNDFLNVVEPSTGTRFHIESTGRLLVFESPYEGPRCECRDGGQDDTGNGFCMCGGKT